MTETEAPYTVGEMAETAELDQQDRRLHHLSQRVASHYMSFLAACMDRETAQLLTSEFQEHLLSLEVGPKPWPFEIEEEGL